MTPNKWVVATSIMAATQHTALAVAFVIVLPLLYFLRVSEKRSSSEHIEMGIE